MISDYDKIGYEFAKGFIRYISGLIVIGAIIYFLFVIFQPLDSTDSGRFSRSGLVPLKDDVTGVWYLRSSNGLTPRLNADGTLYTKDK